MVDISSLFMNFRFAEAIEHLKPLLLFMTGMIIYSVFIFKFYKFISKKDILKLDLEQYSSNSKHRVLHKISAFLLYVLEFVIIMPLVIFFWFLVFSVIIIFFSKEIDPQRVLLMAFSLVGSIRAIAYYSENLSQELAKMLPLTLLAIFLVDASYFSLDNSVAILRTLPSLWEIIVYYLLLIVFLEIVFRGVRYLLSPLIPEKDYKKDTGEVFQVITERV